MLNEFLSNQADDAADIPVLNLCKVFPQTQGDSDCLAGRSLAMVYTPPQQFRKLYSAEQALQCGTLFEELSKPFLGRKGLR